MLLLVQYYIIALLCNKYSATETLLPGSFRMKLSKFEGIPKDSRIIHTLIDRSNLKKGCQFIRDIGNKIGL